MGSQTLNGKTNPLAPLLCAEQSEVQRVPVFWSAPGRDTGARGTGERRKQVARFILIAILLTGLVSGCQQEDAPGQGLVDIATTLNNKVSTLQDQIRESRFENRNLLLRLPPFRCYEIDSVDSFPSFIVYYYRLLPCTTEFVQERPPHWWTKD